MFCDKRATGSRPCLFALLLVLGLVGCQGADNSAPTDDSASATAEPVPTPAKTEEQDALPDNLLLHLSFDMKSMCIRDGRPYTKDMSGNLNGAFLRDVVPIKGRFGSAVSLDGKKSRIAGSDARLPAGSSPVSISLWFQIRKAGFQVLFAYGTADTPEAREVAILDPPGLSFFRWGKDDVRVQNVPISLNEWHHCVVTYDDNKEEVTFYLDGVKKGTFTGLFWTTRSGYSIGSSKGEGMLEGAIDELMVFAGAISEADVQKLYQRKEYSEDAKLSFDTLPECGAPRDQ